LAFAVAAHLEPEILIVDEVLAVGDSEFQKKCLGKIGDIASTGRTILFVSHNLTSIRALCGVALLLNKGRAQTFGAAALTIDQYRSNYQASRNRVSWPECDAPGDSDVKLLEVSVSQAGAPADFFTTGTPITIVFRVICSSVPRDLSIGFELSTDDGTSLLWSHHTDLDESMWPRIEVGMNVVTCSIPPGILNAGRYLLAPKLSIHRQRWIANLDHLLALEVHLGHGTSPFWTTLSGGKRWGLIAPIFDWSSEAKADV
jgi:lipopolysaccharide transport system ATP-binding protein